MKISEIQTTIGIKFKNQDLLKEALTHRSYLNEHPRWGHPHNERLEYLGDAALELAVSESLYGRFPNAPEGQLTVLRAALVNYKMLSVIAREISLDSFILMSKSEMRDTGKARDVILANALEALIGAIYLDNGFKKVREWIQKAIIVKHLENILETKSYRDPKSQLQEIMQEKFKVTPSYKVLGESGPAHERRFKVGVYLRDEIIGEGGGASKQTAEVEAARGALRHLPR